MGRLVSEGTEMAQELFPGVRQHYLSKKDENPFTTTDEENRAKSNYIYYKDSCVKGVCEEEYTTLKCQEQ